VFTIKYNSNMSIGTTYLLGDIFLKSLSTYSCLTEKCYFVVRDYHYVFFEQSAGLIQGLPV
jgi:hypothetical protein